MNRLRRSWRIAPAAGFLLTLVPVSVAAQVPPTAASINSENRGAITEAMRREDPRLLQRVTVRSPRLYVGELLEMLQVQTGVALSASDTDGTAGELVTVFLQDVPLGDALESLWSLLSYQGAERRWGREGEAGKYHYQFERPAAVDALAGRLREEIQNEFAADVDKRLQALKMSPGELKAAAKEDPTLSSLVNDKTARAALTMVVEALTAAQRQDLLRGKGDDVTFAADDLPPSALAFLAAVQNEKQQRHPGETFSAPRQVVIHRSGAFDSVTPTLSVGITYPNSVSSVYIGGAAQEGPWRERLADLWLLPGDTATDAAHEAVITPLSPANDAGYASEKERWSGWMERRFAQMTFATPSLSVLARLPRRLKDSFESPMPAPKDQTLGKALNNLTAWSGQPHKWRRNVLLIGVQNGVSGTNGKDAGSENARIPWLAVKKLRAEEAANGGFLNLETLCWAVANLTRGECQRLGFEDFPALGRIDGSPLRTLLEYLGRRRPGYIEQIRSARPVDSESPRRRGSGPAELRQIFQRHGTYSEYTPGRGRARPAAVVYGERASRTLAAPCFPGSLRSAPQVRHVSGDALSGPPSQHQVIYL